MIPRFNVLETPQGQEILGKFIVIISAVETSPLLRADLVPVYDEDLPGKCNSWRFSERNQASLIYSFAPPSPGWIISTLDSLESALTLHRQGRRLGTG